MPTIFPSLISADLLNIRGEIKKFDPHCSGYHLDIMDNHFVPNLTWGASFINAIAKETQRILWVHLMVDNPHNWIETLALPPGSIVSFHFELTEEKIKLIKNIKEKKWLVSITINPKTPVDVIFPLLNLLDHVLIMSVKPGFPGQSFISSVVNKIDPLIGYRQTSDLDFKIGIDGGVNKSNIAMLAQKGIDHFAISAGIFYQPNPLAALRELQKIVDENNA